MKGKIAKGAIVTEQTTQAVEQSNDNVPQTKEKPKIWGHHIMALS